MTHIEDAGAALAAARARRDSHFPDAAAAAADAVPHPGPERDQAETAIRSLWDHAIATQSPGRSVSPPSLTDRAAVSA